MSVKVNSSLSICYKTPPMARISHHTRLPPSPLHPFLLRRTKHTVPLLPPPSMAFITTPHLAFLFGLLGNIIAFMVYLAPLPTFYRIYRKRSTEGFQSIPYSVALFSATLTLYYGLLKPDGFMLITINTIGCVIEGIYLIMYMIFASKGAKLYTTKMLILFNTLFYGGILFFTYLFAKGSLRIKIVGWICAVFSVCVYAAPLSIIRRVIKTKSVEYLPFSLSFCLTLCATMWFFYGFLIKDYYIALPNILGFLFGLAQMLLYVIYKESKKGLQIPEHKLQELIGDKFVAEENTKTEGGNQKASAAVAADSNV